MPASRNKPILPYEIKKKHGKVTLTRGSRWLLRQFMDYFSMRIGKKGRPSVPSGKVQVGSGEELFRSAREILSSSRQSILRFLAGLKRKRISRSTKQHRRKYKNTSSEKGRNVRLVQHVPGKTILSPYASIISAVHNGHYQLHAQQFRIRNDDFRGWQKRVQESLTLIFLVDVSRSTHRYKTILAEILSSLRGYFDRNNDRIGLISLQGSRARILNHPTRNHRVVVKNLAAMTIEGDTPLADGLFKAREMADLEKSRKPGSRSLVVLFSDCFPEPITGSFPDIFDEPAYENALRAATFYRDNNLPLVIISPGFNEQTRKRLNPGQKLARRLARLSGGQVIGLATVPSYFDSREYLASERKDLNRILSVIEEQL